MNKLSVWLNKHAPSSWIEKEGDPRGTAAPNGACGIEFYSSGRSLDICSSGVTIFLDITEKLCELRFGPVAQRQSSGLLTRVSGFRNSPGLLRMMNVKHSGLCNRLLTCP